MYNFCTLFDKNYLTRGLALYYSLEKHCDNFHLYIFPFDEITYSLLKQLKLSKVTLISLKEFEDEKLLAVKPGRTVAEYCWTSTSSTILYVLNNFEVDNCTYIDADLFFYSSPKPLFDELGDKSILLTEHRYSPQYNKEIKSGKYCVQFVTFKNNSEGRKALQWWRERCIEWCFNRFEDGKFGDQLYLDDWTERFDGVHVLKHLGGGLASWNIQQYNIHKKNGALYVSEKNNQVRYPVVFYHFHYLRFFTNNEIELGRRFLSDEVKEFFYKPYIFYLESMKEIVKNIDNSFDPHGSSNKPVNWKTPILYFYRKTMGVYNIFKLKTFIGTVWHT